MCNIMVSYFKINEKFQRNKRQSISEQSYPSILEQLDQSMSAAIRVEHIRYGSSRLDQKNLRGIIGLENSGVKVSGEKYGRSEQIKNIKKREKRRAKRKKKILVIRS